MITNAELARHVAGIELISAKLAHGLAEGMWNPSFCSAEASEEALRFCERMRSEIDHLAARARINAAPLDGRTWEAMPR